jgi:hypothetical protein
MLHGAIAMGHNIIPEPAAAKQVETEAELEELFPFTWNISQFRGRDIGERALVVHYVPQVCSRHQVSVGDLGSTVAEFNVLGPCVLHYRTE